MWTTIIVFHVLISIALIGMVLLQQGKGADVGAAFGSGASNTIFGSRGSGSFLTRTTAILFTLFFVTSLTLGYLSGQRSKTQKTLDLVLPTTPMVNEPTGTKSPTAPSSPAPSAPSPSGATSTGTQNISAPAPDSGVGNTPSPAAPKPGQ